MAWFYAEGSQQKGPASEDEFAALLRAGKIGPTTLVWREGMANWQPYQQVATPSGKQGFGEPPGGMEALGQARCVECGRVFPLGELIRFEERFICGTCKPIFFQRLREGAVLPSAQQVWRKGKLLITEKGAVLPDRCIKCNGPIEGRRIAKILYWHPPWVYLLLLVTLLLYVVVALIIRKKAPIVVPICDRHYHVRLVAIISAWLAGIGGLAVFFYGLSQADGVMAIIGILGIIAGAVVYSVKGVLVSARKLTEEHLWVHGCGPEYLKAFAEWPGKP